MPSGIRRVIRSRAVTFSIYDPDLCRKALQAASEIDRLILYPDRLGTAETAIELLSSFSECHRWQPVSDPVKALGTLQFGAADSDVGNKSLDPSTESVLADIFVRLNESPVGLFDRMPGLIREMQSLATSNLKNADRKQLLRLRDFFLGLCGEVHSVRRASVV
jgi:hypothetical protein